MVENGSGNAGAAAAVEEEEEREVRCGVEDGWYAQCWNWGQESGGRLSARGDCDDLGPGAGIAVAVAAVAAGGGGDDHMNHQEAY